MESRVDLFARIRRDGRVDGLSVRALAARHGGPSKDEHGETFLRVRLYARFGNPLVDVGPRYWHRPKRSSVATPAEHFVGRLPGCEA
jgi:hypothetical protein